MGDKTFYVPKDHQMKVSSDKTLQGGQSVSMDEVVGNRYVIQGLLLTEGMYQAQVKADESMRLADEALENARAEESAARQAQIRAVDPKNGLISEEPVRVDTSAASEKIKAQQALDAEQSADRADKIAHKKAEKGKA